MASNDQEKDKLSEAAAAPPGELTSLTSALKDLVTNLGKENNRSINVTKITSQNFRPEKFQPSVTESPSTWLSKFKSWLTINHIEDLETIKHSFRLLMPDNDLSWFDSLTILTREDIFNKFEEYFKSKQPHWIIEQSLWNKTMNASESMDTYISDIQRLSTRLEKSDKETMTTFVRGLPPYIRMHVVQRDPKTFQDACHYARVCQEAFNFGQQPTSPDKSLQTIIERQQQQIDNLTTIVNAMNTNDNVESKCAAGQSEPSMKCQLCDKSNHSAN